MRRIILPVGERSKALLVVCALLCAWGCVEVGRDKGAVQEEALQIEAYSVRAQSLESSRRHVLEAWTKVAEAPTYEAFHTMLRSRAVPAVEAYLTALEGCVVEHGEINKVHGALVEAYGRFVRGIRALSSKVATRPPEKVEEDLRSLLSDARQAQVVYRQDMSVLYARNGYQLVVDEMEAGLSSFEKKD